MPIKPKGWILLNMLYFSIARKVNTKKIENPRIKNWNFFLGIKNVTYPATHKKTANEIYPNIAWTLKLIAKYKNKRLLKSKKNSRQVANFLIDWKKIKKKKEKSQKTDDEKEIMSTCKR